MHRERWILLALTVSTMGANKAARVEQPLCPCKAEEVNGTRTFQFGGQEALVGWSTTGDVAIDATKTRAGKPGALKVGPGATARFKARDADGSGKVEMWVFDDGTLPKDVKTSRAGPRWGIVQGDGRVVAVGVLYASYLGGNEGYTAMSCDGSDWFDRLFWLGIQRGKPEWHHWTFDFDAEEGLRIFHDGRESTAFDGAKAGLKGFRSVAVWGDSGKGAGQSVWISEVSVELGGPTKLVQAQEADPYAASARGSAPVETQKVYTRANAPATLSLESLARKDRVTQYGITWTFARPVRVGQFINGDWYVVGPATVSAIDPKPLYGSEIPRRELDPVDRDRPESQRVRNGFMLNPPARAAVAYDSGVRNWFEPTLVRRLPVALVPGDSLVSTISMSKGLVLHAPLRNKIERGVDDSSPIRTAAVLTCVTGPQPPDAFRPSFCDRKATTYLSRNLRRDRLPSVVPTKSVPDIQQYVRFTQRPWVGTGFFGFEEPVENMPQYGLEFGRVSGITALLLCTRLEPEVKERLLVNYVQVGIDLGGMVRAGHPGWTGWGGHGSGRKLPIVVAGLLFDDPMLGHVNHLFPRVSFGEDEQTAYGPCWTGAGVVFAGHSGIDAVTGAGRSRGNGWGPYEHLPPAEWKNGNHTSEAYRRCCTSVGWVAQALALRLMHAETSWDHDAFFDYVDRWMFEDDATFVKTIKQATGRDHDREWARQGQAWDAFVNEMWARYRPPLAAPTDGWKRPHDEGRYRKALQLMK